MSETQDITRVRDVPNEGWRIVTDGRAVCEYVDRLGLDDPTEWASKGSLFVQVEPVPEGYAGDGPALVWFPGNVPYLHDPATVLRDPETGDVPSDVREHGYGAAQLF